MTPVKPHLDAPARGILATPLELGKTASSPSGFLAPEMVGFANGPDIAPAALQANSKLWPTTLGGVSLEIVDSHGAKNLAPIHFVTQTQIAYLIPSTTALGPATVRLTTATGSTLLGAAEVRRIAPALYSTNNNSSGVAAGSWVRVDANGQQSPNSGFTEPVDLGVSTDQVFLSLRGTGFRNSTGAVAATVGGVNVPIYGVAPAPESPGDDVVSIGPLPRALAGSGEVAVVLAFDNQPANAVTINVR